MKIKKFINQTRMYYVGATSDIKALYKSIVRHSEECGIMPLFQSSPKFNIEKSTYALCIEYTDFYNNYVTVVNSDTMLAIICDGEVEEV